MVQVTLEEGRPDADVDVQPVVKELAQIVAGYFVQLGNREAVARAQDAAIGGGHLGAALAALAAED